MPRVQGSPNKGRGGQKLPPEFPAENPAEPFKKTSLRASSVRQKAGQYWSAAVRNRLGRACRR